MKKEREINKQLTLQYMGIFVLIGLFLIAQKINADRTFSVDYNRNVFLKDGQPFRYISGEFHYFRVPADLWDDRLMRVRHAGLNAIQVYIPWNFHETMPGVFDFASGSRNLTRFVQLAQKNELFVLLRIGPYACAEWENGGLPWWLLRSKDIKLRTSDEKFIQQVDRYFTRLLPIVEPLLYKNGGPVLMLQIENEYGSVLCDKQYLRWLRDRVHNALGSDTQLYTTDGPGEGNLRCGTVEGVFTTVDFGPSSMQSVQSNFNLQRNFSKGGPHVNSEFYTVWFSGWGEHSPHFDSGTIKATLETMDYMHEMNASFSFYMIHGGTNFGFWSGAETTGPVVTSYDYEAPISEAGQITPLYLAIREWINKLPNWPNPPMEVPRNHTAVSVDNVKAVRLGDMMTVINNTVDQTHCRSSDKPLAFEELDSPFDLVWYSSVLPEADDHYELEIESLHDYAYVFVDGVSQGYLAICEQNIPEFCKKTLKLRTGKTGAKLDILVESHGRLTFPTRNDPKGILSDVKLNGRILRRWLHCGIDPNRLYSASKQIFRSVTGIEADDGSPGVYLGTFESEVAWPSFHTFFDSRPWTKGLAIVNNFNLGRYWPSVGPQMTLYVPGLVLRKKNVVVLVELLGRTGSNFTEEAPSIKFVDEPIYVY